MSFSPRALAVALGLTLLTPLEALAAHCGGTRVCACGDKVVEDYRLRSDLGPCAKDGLRVEGRVTIDGGSRTLRGSGGVGVGLRLGESASGSQVRDLVVTGFEHGVRIVGARDVRLSAIEARNNGDPGPREGYGIDLAAAASGAVLERVRVHDNADEGIHVGAGATGNRIVDSEVFGNGRENVYFLACRDNRLERSRVRASGTKNASIYIKFAVGTILKDNQIDGGTIELRGGARDTLLIGNVLRQASIGLKEQDDKRFGRGTPSGTTLRGGSITAPGACVRIDAAAGTRIEDVALSCPEGIGVASGSRVAVRLPGSGKGKDLVRCAGGSDCVEPPSTSKAPPSR